MTAHNSLPVLGKDSLLELLLRKQLRSKNVPTPKLHYRFEAGRKWEFDLAWPEYMTAAEVEGGQWTKGRHYRPQGFEGDCAKYNAATRSGWRVYRFTSDMVTKGDAAEYLVKVLLRPAKETTKDG